MADENEIISEGEAGEDVPSNFFDDFDKDEFLEGLEVIDSLQDDDEKEPSSNKQDTDRRSASSSRLDEYIKPGSRRDPAKTNAAIRRDKEVKVKEHLAKHLESQDDLRPPGTELDDYFDDVRPSKIKKNNPKNEVEHEERWSGPREKEYHESPRWHSPPTHAPWRGHRDPWRSSHRGARYYSHHYPRHGYRYSPRRSPQYSLRRSPYYRSRHSPRRSPRRSPRYSPRRVSKRSPRHSPRNSPSRSSRHSPRPSPGRKYSPQRSHRRSPHRSPRYTKKQSPHRSPRHSSQQDKRSSPRKHSPSHHKPHWSPRRSPQPVSSHSENYIPQPDLNTYNPQYSEQQYNPEIPAMSAPYPYTYSEPYNPYAVQPVLPGMPMPQPVPMPMNPVPTPMVLQPNPVSNYITPEPVQMVPPPLTSPVVPQATSLHNQTQPVPGVKAPYDALAQLVADGKLSKEDYLKLTPSIKGGNSLMDDKTRITVLTRCSQAVEKLDKLINPFRFMVAKKKFHNEMLSLPEKYVSPLKRQAPVEFEFTKPADQSGTQNKRLINNIVATIGLEKAFRKTKISRDVKSVGVQTTKPYCDMCEIRDSRIKCDVGVSTDALILTNTVHTQVVEQDLLNSKAIFNPRGSVGDGAPISIAHLTPAQLVSQLAARAKTFQQAEAPSTSNQYPRRAPPNSYDGRGGDHYHPNYLYRY